MSVRHFRPYVFAIAVPALLVSSFAVRAAADPTKTVAVDCGAGGTIAKALTLGDPRKPMLIQISGTCSESVLIDRDDVTLTAASGGATVSGPDPATDVVTITGSRVTIDGVIVTGGRNGIFADGARGLTVHNTTAQSTGRNGITYARGASGLIDGATVAGNARDGIAVDAASATIVNSQVTQNGRHGVGVFTNGSARIGIDDANNPAGNVIGANGAIGINIVVGSTALVAMNQVIGNGTNAAPGNPRFGISLANASADIIGGNTISGNAGTGINLRSSSLVLGDTTFGITTVNTITGNGNAASPAGVFAFLDSSLNIRDAVISNNSGFGLVLSLRSEAQIANSTVQNNVPAGASNGDGIRLVFGSGLFATTPNTSSSVTGNAGWGLNCTDGESSVVNSILLGIGANGLGGTSPSCTGF